MADYELSTECARVTNFALILCNLRESAAMEPRDWLGALYLVAGDRLSAYWSADGGFARLIAQDETLAHSVEMIQSEGQRTFSGLGVPFSAEAGSIS